MFLKSRQYMHFGRIPFISLDVFEMLTILATYFKFIYWKEIEYLIMKTVPTAIVLCLTFKFKVKCYFT